MRGNDAVIRRITAAALIVGTVVFLAGNILHPKEYTRGHEVEQLETIADSYTRWQFTHFLIFIAIVCFVFAVCGLALLLGDRAGRGRQALIGGSLGLVGLVAIAGVLALDGFTWGVLGQVYTWEGTDLRSIQNAMHAVQEARWNLPFYVGALAWLVGLVILSVGVIRERMVPAWAGWALAAGAVLVGVEAAVQNNVYFIVAAAVLAIGGIGVGAALMRDPTTSAPDAYAAALDPDATPHPHAATREPDATSP